MHRRVRRSLIPPHITKAQALAREAADDYFATIAGGVALDTSVPDPNLIDGFVLVADALVTEEHRQLGGYQEGAAMHAGFLLGVEFGRRLGGGR
jgi:hypothetical protein